MGGAKKKSPAQQEKAQTGDSAKVSGKKGKKSKEKESGPARAEIRVILPDAQAGKITGGTKAITALELARQAGVKASVAGAYLAAAARDGRLRVAGGRSGHRVYAAASASTSPAPAESSSPA
ncbi:MAG: MarR family transcriptional regulator [Thaumarchaeota archaeon]|nr:MarR family transcriptional regulator [Nitrososphaerota archaeon]